MKRVRTSTGPGIGPVLWLLLGLIVVVVAVIVLLQVLGDSGGLDQPDLNSPPKVPDFSSVTPATRST